MIEMNILGLDARPRQRIDLVSGILFCTGDSRITEQHLSKISHSTVFRPTFPHGDSAQSVSWTARLHSVCAQTPRMANAFRLPRSQRTLHRCRCDCARGDVAARGLLLGERQCREPYGRALAHDGLVDDSRANDNLCVGLSNDLVVRRRRGATLCAEAAPFRSAITWCGLDTTIGHRPGSHGAPGNDAARVQ